MRALLLLPLLALGACAGVPSADQCATARLSLTQAEKIAADIDFTPEHQAWADKAVVTAEALVAAPCPMP
jgi:hypothetical protein